MKPLDGAITDMSRVFFTNWLKSCKTRCDGVETIDARLDGTHCYGMTYYMSCELILKAANTWMTANPVTWQSALNSASNLMEEESKREKIELANYDYILTPLLRIPYLISPHSLGYSEQVDHQSESPLPAVSQDRSWTGFGSHFQHVLHPC